MTVRHRPSAWWFGLWTLKTLLAIHDKPVTCGKARRKVLRGERSVIEIELHRLNQSLSVAAQGPPEPDFRRSRRFLEWPTESLKRVMGLGRRASDLGEQAVVVVDARGGVGGLDGPGPSSVDDADVDPLLGNHDGSLAADPPLYA